MMRRFLIFCLLITLACPALGQEALPRITLNAPQLNYVFARPGEVETGGETLAVTVKYRGTYSATFTGKRNYSFHLKDAAGKQLKSSLLGLRCDDDYVLLGALSDPSRLRNAVGMDLWRSLGHPAPAHAACEVTYSGYYKGLYFLFERPDRKSAGVPKDGALYRVLAAKVDGVNALTDAAPAPVGDTWYNIGKIYPGADAGWQPLINMLADPEAYLDLNAFADYFLFVNLTGASDNMSKNLYLCWDGTRFYPMPWDLDAAFGRLYNAETSDPDHLYSSPFFDELLTLPAFCAALKARFTVISPLLSPESVVSRFESAYQALNDTGVWAREAERFPVYTNAATGHAHALDPAGEIAALPAFLSARLSLVTAFLQKLP